MEYRDFIKRRKWRQYDIVWNYSSLHKCHNLILGELHYLKY